MATKVTTGLIANDAITSTLIGAGAIVHADLHSNMDLTAKTVLVANASTGDNDTTAANTAFVQQEIAALVDSAPGTLNTLNELAAALGDDANFSTTVTNSIATKVPLAGGTMTGTLTGVGVVTNGARNIIQRSNDDASIAFANNASGTPSSHTWAVGYDYSASNGFAIAYASNGLPSLTGSQKFGLDTSGNATFAGAITATELTITGGSDGADLHINNTSPTLGFTDTNSFSDSDDIYIVRGGSTGDLLFQFYDDSASSTTTTFQIDETGNTTIGGTVSSGTHQLNDHVSNVVHPGQHQVLYLCKSS